MNAPQTARAPDPTPQRFLAGVFLAMVVSVPLIQMATEARRGEWPSVLGIFSRRPTAREFRQFEKGLENASVVAHTLRPWVQALQFRFLGDAGEKAVVGRDGWLFYRPGLGFLTQRRQPGDSGVSDALAAVVDFRDALAARGIRLVLMPVPNKESIYPDRLTAGAPVPTGVLGAETRLFLEGCRETGVDVIDLFAVFREARRTSPAPLYLRQDSHWSPAGMALAAVAAARHLAARGHEEWVERAMPVRRHGDLVRMLRSPVLEAWIEPETVACSQVRHRRTDQPYADDPASEVLVLGDSFLRIYQEDEPGRAGFVAHLARELGRPLASIVNDGGASTLVRQELFRRPSLLARTRVVLWEFTERDLRLGTEGWQKVPLPPPPLSSP